MKSDADLASALFHALPRHPAPPKGLKQLRNAVWTQNKARLIATYLRLFTFITKHGAYIDGFAGPQNPSDHDAWAARLVLGNQPAWLRQFALNDLDPVKAEILRELHAAQPTVAGRKIVVENGDFNENWLRLLQLAGVTESVATFCLIDQRTFQCRWSTVRGLAAFKAPPKKIELFYFLPAAWWDRAASETHDKTKIDEWWGGPDWGGFKDARTNERGAMFAQRFIDEFGYATAKPWPIRSAEVRGRIMYYMIHATDHPVAPDLMHRAYRIATKPAEQAEQLTLDLTERIRLALPGA